MTTDLTAAFDTVDTDILLQKLNHYGIRNKELRLIDNYMTDRQQYVQIDTYNSQIDKSPKCSTIQGSKMSGLLYTLYTNEVPLLHNLLHDNIYTQMTNDTNMTTYKDIEHYTINFVDDSTSIITFKTTNMVKDYLQKYYRLIHDYYTINKLKINSDKTQLMLTYKPKHKDYFKDFFF